MRGIMFPSPVIVDYVVPKALEFSRRHPSYKRRESKRYFKEFKTPLKADIARRT